ncbi:MAG: serine/threonine-protein phosphatase [Methylomonas sp.]|jgi:serine phosphatase RsbU (regulator of sigma subunit)|uniref:ATP-binding SpoIIE family protein phosphatase n=1 Tax=Methylomonas sp. TaxID=418 RepID=UPI0025F71BB7|nr:ATP-binding SpoIIE family protein phosphatase [Methylomonas sp.]MCK9608629.1 serine/threonine-protein phosphatase [Methylomonas sp.]
MNLSPPNPANPEIILWISDEIIHDQSLLQFLVKAGYRIQCAVSAPEATKFLETEDGVGLLIIATTACLNAEVDSFRRLADDYLPIIVVSEVIDDALMDGYQDANVDSYVVRPVNFRLLQTKIKSAFRMRQLYQHECDQHSQLMCYRQNVEIERELAAKIYNAVLQSNLLQTEAVKSVMSPLALFNGDLLLVEKTPDNQLYLLLGDFTGHGLSASVGATPVADVFYGMTRKGFSLPDIVQEINLKLYNMLPTNMFLAATAVGLYPDSKTLSMITCGLPEHFIVSDLDGKHTTVKSKNIPLGILDRMELEIKNFSVDNHHHVFLMTDGVLEAKNSRGEAFGYERALSAIKQNPGDGLAVLHACLNEHSRGSSQQDDISLVELVCDVDQISWQTSPAAQTEHQPVALHWKSVMEFDIDALRIVNPVPVLVNALMEIQGLKQYRQAIFLIVSELFANALDHGVLKLDSAVKSTPEGFMRFYQLKQDRLSSWAQGKVRLSAIHKPTPEGGQLTIKVTDSGDGFDWKMPYRMLEGNEGFCGRGVKLVESLCSSLTYHGKGNRVTAVFDWKSCG